MGNCKWLVQKIFHTYDGDGDPITFYSDCEVFDSRTEAKKKQDEYDKENQDERVHYQIINIKE